MEQSAVSPPAGHELQVIHAPTENIFVWELIDHGALSLFSCVKAITNELLTDTKFYYQ